MRNYDGKNNDIFLAGDDALEYLVGPVHKKYSISKYVPLVRADLMTIFFILPTSSTCTHMNVFRVPPPFAYVISSI